jgi:chromosome segregation ATPase
MCQGSGVGAAPDQALVERLREVLASERVTETELRELIDQAGGLVRALTAQVTGSEHRLTQLSAAVGAPLSEMASELHRIETLRPQLDEARSLAAELEERARVLRTSWLVAQAGTPRSPTVR